MSILLRHGSLFSGIGGFDLAAEWMGWENIFHCEWNPFGQKVLKHYWPNAISYYDIIKTDFSIHRGTIDILTGGFPCQPYSSAGKRLGKEDDRHLWPEMLRAIQEIKPRWVVGENVRGLVSWNGGLVFEEVQTDLENAGYEVQSFLLPACGVNAPHKRDRIWFVAFNSKSKRNTSFREFCKRENSKSFGICSNDKQQDVTYANNKGRGAGFREVQKENGEIPKRNNNAKFSNSNFTFEGFPTVSAICDGDDGLSSRLDSITFSKWRKESIKAGGNAIVPQVVYQIFKAIELFNQQNQIT